MYNYDSDIELFTMDMSKVQYDRYMYLIVHDTLRIKEVIRAKSLGQSFQLVVGSEPKLSRMSFL